MPTFSIAARQMTEVIRLGLSRQLRGLIAVALVPLVVNAGAAWIEVGLAGGDQGVEPHRGRQRTRLFRCWRWIVGPLLIGTSTAMSAIGARCWRQRIPVASLALALMALALHLRVSDLFGEVMPAQHDAVLFVVIGIAGIEAQPLLYGVVFWQMVWMRRTPQASSAINPGVLPRRAAP
jgi:hypothetical protein